MGHRGIKRGFCLLALCGLAFALGASALERPSLHPAVIGLCKQEYPEHVITASDGFGDERAGQWALILSKAGQHVLAVAEKAKDEPAYRFTVENPRAIMAGDSQPGVLMDSAGDAVFISFWEEDTRWSFHAVRENGEWSQVDAIQYHQSPGFGNPTAWGMFIKDGLLFSEYMNTDGSDNVQSRYPYPPIPAPRFEGKTQLGNYDWALFPDNPGSLLRVGETPRPDSLAALTPKGWTLRQAEATPLGIHLLGRDEKDQTRLLLKRWLAEGEDMTRGAYRDTMTRPLPADAWIDREYLYLSPSGPGFTLSHAASGGWRLSFIMGEDWFDVYPTFLHWNGVPESSYAVGTTPWGDVSTLDFTALPLTFKEAVKHLDQRGWAMVNQPDPLLSLHLREMPESDAKSLGAFCHGTPLRVLERRGEWARVGLPGLSGWMMARHLAFDLEINQVRPSFLHLLGADSTIDQDMPLYIRPDETSPVAFRRNIYQGNDYWIVGVAADAWFYVYFPREDIGGFMKRDLFTAGDD